jgi:glucosamine kinase
MDNIKYILGVDGGGTKTVARLINLETNEKWESITGQSSLSNDLEDAINNLKTLVKDISIKADVDLKNASAVFGLAGTGNAEIVNQVMDIFKNTFDSLDIVSDASTSAYGANLGEEVAVVALGTGTVGMRFKKEGNIFKEEIVGGWGFLIGDEGSGAKMGYYAVQALINEFQKYKRPQSSLGCAVARFISDNKEIKRSDISLWLRTAKPADFAQLAPEVIKNNDCLIANRIMKNHIDNVEVLIHDTRANSKLPVALLGGLANFTRNLLSNETKSFLITPKGDSLDGACLIAKNKINY